MDDATATQGWQAPGRLPDENPSDRLHLKLLMIFHYVLGGVSIGTGLHVFLVFAMWLFFGLLAWGMGGDQALQSADNDARLILTIFVVGWSLGALLALCYIIGGPISLAAGRKLRDRKNYHFCRRWAWAQCFMLFPLGIPLGVCTLKTLKRDSVRALFAARDISRAATEDS